MRLGQDRADDFYHRDGISQIVGNEQALAAAREISKKTLFRILISSWIN
jgi:hypothetical protein